MLPRKLAWAVPPTTVAEEKDPGLTPLVTVLSAYAPHIDGLNDVATVMMQPLVTPKEAAPVAILLSAQYARTDVAFPEQTRRTVEKELYSRATEGDPKLWYSRAWLVLDDAESRGLVEAVDPLKKIAADVPLVPEGEGRGCSRRECAGVQWARVQGLHQRRDA